MKGDKSKPRQMTQVVNSSDEGWVRGDRRKVEEEQIQVKRRKEISVVFLQSLQEEERDEAAPKSRGVDVLFTETHIF